MKILYTLLTSCILITIMSCKTETDSWIRINQLGYRNNDVKVAVLISMESLNLKEFKITDEETGKTIMSSSVISKTRPLIPFKSCYRLNFSELKKDGIYRIKAGNIVSPAFRINENVYDGTADFLLNYMRQQRCGFNPYRKDSCHTHDGYEIYGKSSEYHHVDVTGGWHDAADYLQYVTTSANATFQMLFAYSENKASFSDKYLANGLHGSDGIPDVLNECRWGLDWLVKMNPAPGVMYNQIADDRDHIGFRYPDNDTANYGKGKERPVYLCTGKPQGLFKYKNRTTGIASTAGKYASAFAKGCEVYQGIDNKFSALLLTKAITAFNYGLENPGACQTAPGTAPYFYEEDNWVDDMELAAIELYNLTKDKKYLSYAEDFGRKETVSPWMGSDTARHYQWYPFVNLGHPVIAREQQINSGNEFADFMKKGLEKIKVRGSENPFHIGIPFIWCSNNYISAVITQAHLYAEITGDTAYSELEAAHRDWLFGCNPWGTSMIVGLPEKGTFPANSHSSYVVKGGQVYGGLVDGPVYPSIFNKLKYLYLSKKDIYAPFQTSMAVYHDDYADYSTNECTMDGTASLVYYLSAMQSGKKELSTDHNIIRYKGAVVRMDTTKKYIYLCFTAHDFSDGFDTIIKTLHHHNVKASFFLTGDFLRNPENKLIIGQLKSDGHYIGPHSDKHLLYCSWEKRDSTLLTRDLFLNDLKNNYRALYDCGIPEDKARVFLPSYEWHNDTIASWAEKTGIKMVNISSGIITNQDWTFPDKGHSYFSSDTLMNNFLSYEAKKGLKGYILLIHPGTDPRRKDKFYLRLDSVLCYLERKKYTFHSFSEIN